MSNIYESSARVRYVVTDAGRSAMTEPTSCECQPRFVETFLLCERCGTVYGTFRQANYSWPVKREKRS